MPQAQFQAQQMPVSDATMEAFLAGMTGVQAALQQLMEHQRQQAASSSQPGGPGFDPDHIPLFQYTRLNEVVFDGVSGDPMDFLYLIILFILCMMTVYVGSRFHLSLLMFGI